MISVAAAARPQLKLMWLAVTTTVILIPSATWIYSLGDPLAYLRHALPSGQRLYLFSKLLGLYSLVALTVQLSLGMRLATATEPPVTRKRFNYHRILGTACLLLVVSHAGSFVGAVSARTHHFARDYVVPSFGHGFYRSMVSVGMLAFALLVVAMLSRAFRRRSPRASGGLHRLAFISYILILIHSLTIGSESRMGIMPALYGASIAVVLVSLIQRLRNNGSGQ